MEPTKPAGALPMETRAHSMIKDKQLYDRLVGRTRVDAVTGCWLWTGYVRPSKWPQNRYGMTSIRGRSICTHRAMVIALYGPQPQHICACHRCDVPLCINPEHLFLGTMGDNIRDSRSKNRHHEAKKDHCDRGHPLFGANVRIQTQKNNGIQRVCKTCESGNRRIRAGWPPELAFSVGTLPPNFALDLATGKAVPRGKKSWDARRRSHSAGDVSG